MSEDSEMAIARVPRCIDQHVDLFFADAAAASASGTPMGGMVRSASERK